MPDNVLVLAVVLILERIMPLSAKYNPLVFFTAISLAIGDKVHSKKRPASVKQQKIAGSLAVPTLLLPFLFLIYMMIRVVEFPQIFDGILVWLCLSWSPVKKDAIALTTALRKNQNSLAKARLTPWVLRRTDNLSPMGLCKATIEMLILRANKQYFAVIFYYLILGSFFTVLYRLVTLLNQCWNPKIRHYQHFGQLAQLFAYLLEWLPARLTGLSIMLLYNFSQCLNLQRIGRHWGNDSSLQLLACTAGSLKVSLGGPVFYNNEKIRRPVLANNKTTDPQPSHVKQTVLMIEKVFMVWCLVILLCTMGAIAIKM